MKSVQDLFQHSDLFHLFQAQWLWWLLLALLALLVGLIGFPFFIQFLKSFRVEQYIREEGPEAHHIKQGTPTGAGIFLIALWVLMSLVWGILQSVLGNSTFQWGSPYFYLPIVVTLSLMGLGMWDDLAKVLKKHNKGLGARAKLVAQGFIGLAFGLVMVLVVGDTHVNVFGHMLTLEAWQYVLYAVFAVTAVSNAVNLTDGLDSLAGSTTALTFYTLALLLLTQSHHAEYLPTVALSVLMIPCLLSFLVYNQYPARIFMGDSGSMALGALIASLGLMTHQDAWLLLIAGIYALEALSVLVQILSFKILKRRIFKMAPVHHHFELCGYHETVVVHGFVLAHGILCLLAFYLQRL